jgi:hypothetical protein
MLEKFLVSIGSVGGKRAVLLALGSLMRVVKQINSKISEALKSGELSVDYLMGLNQRTNIYFSRFVAAWLKTDAQANHFVFDLGGFEFLLDIIGKSKERKLKAPSQPEQLSNEISELLAGLEGSDLVEMIPLDSKPEKVESEEPEEEEENLGDEAPTLAIGELAAKTMQL